jgi:hypothetical protein
MVRLAHTCELGLRGRRGGGAGARALPAWRIGLSGHKSERPDLTFYELGDKSVHFMLMPDERALLATHCNDHPVAVCRQCSEALTVERIGADIIMGQRAFCPMCRADLTTALRQHLAECTVMRVQARETRERARENRQDKTSPQSQQHRDHADGLGHEAENAPQRSHSAGRGSPGGGPHDPQFRDEPREAVRASERLPEEAQKAPGHPFGVER